MFRAGCGCEVGRRFPHLHVEFARLQTEYPSRTPAPESAAGRAQVGRCQRTCVLYYVMSITNGQVKKEDKSWRSWGTFRKAVRTPNSQKPANLGSDRLCRANFAQLTGCGKHGAQGFKWPMSRNVVDFSDHRKTGAYRGA